MVDWKEYIYLDFEVLLGKFIIKGMRILVELIFELYFSGWIIDDILESYFIFELENIFVIFFYLKDCI